MTEWILILYLSTTAATDTQVVSGFTSKKNCYEAGSNLMQEMESIQATATGSAYRRKAAGFKCISVEK